MTLRDKPTPYLISSTKPELHAIATTLTNMPKTSIIKIDTDSQSSLASITKIQSPKLQDRQFLKLNNHMLLTTIKHELTKYTNPVQFNHIPAHTGIEGNERADKIAKQTALDSTIPSTIPHIDPTIANKSENTFLHFAGTLFNQYPSKYIKTHNHQIYSSKLDEYLISKFQSQYPNLPSQGVDLQRTKHQSSCTSHKTNSLDATHFIEQKFRINLLTGRLPLNDRLHSQNILTHNTCPHPACFCPETIDHFLTCPRTLELIP
jgi:ribonuclease HI